MLSLFNPLSSFIQMYQNRRQKQDNGIFHNLVYVSLKYLGTVMYPKSVGYEVGLLQR